MVFRKVLVFSIFFLAIVKIAWVCYEKPLYNWDTLAYMAIVLGFEEDDITKIHQSIYNIAQQEIPIDKYALMTDTTHMVKKDVLNHPDKFLQYTSFFRVKPLYTFLSYAAYKVGLPLSKAPFVPSVFSFVAISFLLVWLFSKFFPEWLSAILSLCIVISPPILEAARLATPDALSTLVILIAFCLLMNSSSWVWIIFILSLSILVRVDNIILAGIILFFQYFMLREQAKNKIPHLAFWIIIALWIGFAFWLMVHANIQNGFENFYGGLSKKVNFLMILKESVTGLNTLQTSHLSIVMAICALILFYGKAFSIRSLNQSQYLFLLMIFYLVIRYVMFPDLTTRFFLPVYIISIVLAMEEIPALVKNQSKK